MLGVGILGAGFFGGVHARAINATPGLRLAAVCAEEAHLAQSFAAMFGGKAYGDWPALLEDRAVDAVLIATPHHLHCEMAIAAAAAGKHLFIEKPMARSAAECSAIIAAADTHAVKLTVGHILHFSRPGLVTRQIIDRGEIGRPVVGSSSLLKLWMEPNRRGWHLDPATGGGMLMTAGIHSLDLLIWLMDSPVAAVFAAAGALFHEQAADDSSIMLSNGAEGLTRIGVEELTTL